MDRICQKIHDPVLLSLSDRDRSGLVFFIAIVIAIALSKSLIECKMKIADRC